MRDYDIESDLKQEKFQSIKLVQGDRGNKIKINVYEDGQPVNLAGCSVTAKYKRADGEIINDGVIENIHDNSFDAVMDSSITKVAGTLKMLFTIEKDDVKVSTFLLLADVRESIGENTGSSGGNTGGGSGEVTIDLSNYYKKIETYSKNQIDARFKDIVNQKKMDKYIDISNLGIKYKIGTTKNTELIQKAFDYCNENNIELRISDTLISTKKINLPKNLRLVGVNQPRFVFAPNEDDICLFTSSYFIGLIDNLFFSTSVSQDWAYNKTYSLFKDAELQGCQITRCQFRAFNIIFDNCQFGCVTLLNHNWTYNIYDAIFNSCKFSDVHIFDNYFNGGKPINDENKGFYPCLFKNGSGGMLQMERNWVEFVKGFLPPCESSNVVGNLFDFVYNGTAHPTSNVNDNIFSHITLNKIITNFNNANIGDVVADFKNPISTIYTTINTNICNNSINDTSLLDDLNTTFIKIIGDKNNHAYDINIKNINLYNLHKCTNMKYMKRFVDYENMDYDVNSDLSNINIDIFTNINMTDFNVGELIYNMPFKINNIKLYPIFKISRTRYPYPILLDEKGNYYNFKTPNSMPLFDNWSWKNVGEWDESEDRKTIKMTPIKIGMCMIYTEIDLSDYNYNILRIKPLDNAELGIQFMNENNKVGDVIYITDEMLNAIPEGANKVRIYLRRNVIQSDIDENKINSYRLPILNLFSEKPQGEVINGDIYVYRHNNEILFSDY